MPTGRRAMARCRQPGLHAAAVPRGGCRTDRGRSGTATERHSRLTVENRVPRMSLSLTGVESSRMGARHARTKYTVSQVRSRILEQPLPHGRGSDQSRDRQGAVFRYVTVIPNTSTNVIDTDRGATARGRLASFSFHVVTTICLPAMGVNHAVTRHLAIQSHSGPVQLFGGLRLIPVGCSQRAEERVSFRRLRSTGRVARDIGWQVARFNAAARQADEDPLEI